ncbi:MAG: hypothetical protein ACRDN8_03240 [Thermoleophilaceae bacterium]
MSSASRTAEREEERRLNMRTLVIASSASAAAALLTSQLWIAGTWIAAAMTPVIVALVSELLHRPTERIARSLTADRAALPAAGGAAPPARSEADRLPDRAPEEPAAGAGLAQPPAPGPGSEAPVRVYRSGEAGPHDTLPGEGGRRGEGAGGRGRAPRGRPPGGRGPVTRRRKIAYSAVFGTAALAFVIAVAAITVPELVAGGSVGKNDGRTTFFSTKKNNDRDRQEQAPQDTTQDEQPQPDEQQQPTTTDEETTPAPEEQPPPLEETSPEEAPPAGEPLPETTPAPPTEQP